MNWLLDTCVVSELIKPRPKASVVQWVGAQDEESLFLSVITLGEIEKGIARLREPAKRSSLERWVRSELADRFRGRLLPVDSSIAARWGAIAGAAEINGQPLPVIDCLIAATSLQHDLTVVTRNVEDFARCGARCLNPWDG